MATVVTSDTAHILTSASHIAHIVAVFNECLERATDTTSEAVLLVGRSNRTEVVAASHISGVATGDCGVTYNTAHVHCACYGTFVVAIGDSGEYCGVAHKA